jgi:GntR family transcriptional regulator, transcriptional repressor for pyruvate dehydrogenase complex
MILKGNEREIKFSSVIVWQSRRGTERGVFDRRDELWTPVDVAANFSLWLAVSNNRLSTLRRTRIALAIHRSLRKAVAVADQTQIERIALETVAGADGPVGASRLVERLSQHDIELSEATAGRFLRSLDRRGLTQTVGKRGRLLTEAGRLRLRELEIMQHQDEQTALLVGAASPVDVGELIDLLYVRRAVEPEAARHAAMRATNEERADLQALADSHVHHVIGGGGDADAALDLHRLVARASHNKMLIAVAGLTVDPSTNGLSTLLDLISSEAGAQFTFAHEHREIVDAILGRDPDRAETLMREHIDDLIKVVELYRQSVTLHTAPIRFVPVP